MNKKKVKEWHDKYGEGKPLPTFKIDYSWTIQCTDKKTAIKIAKLSNNPDEIKIKEVA